MASRTIRMIAVIAMVLVVASTAVVLLWRSDPNFFLEDDIVEMSQAVCLLLAVIAHARQTIRGGDRHARVIRHGLAVFCMSLAVRELDIDLMVDPAMSEAVEWSVRGAVALWWVVFVFTALPLVASLWARRRVLLLSSMSVMTMLGCALYAASWPFDKFPAMLAKSVALLVEETLQLNAALLLLMAALVGSLPVPQERAPDDAMADRMA